MKISGGMAEINLPRGSETKKVYLWPGYPREKVQPAPIIHRRTEGQIPYFKASPAERERIISQYRESSYQEYSPAGNREKTVSPVAPGSLFEAVV